MTNDPLILLSKPVPALAVRGTHSTEKPPVAPALNGDFTAEHSAALTKVFSTPGGYDGRRAVLTHWAQDGNELVLSTHERTYTEGLGLKHALRNQRQRLKGLLGPNAYTQPQADIAWGSNLCVVVLLPDDRVLAGLRAKTLQVNPNIWTCSMTEVLEPSDVHAQDMSPVLHRLIAEELPALSGLGKPAFVGVGLRTSSYAWCIVGVLDLRKVDGALEAVGNLKPDAETQAWAAVPMNEPSGVQDVDFARTLATLI